MRILHTSDWHLGRTLEGRSRLEEQAQFLDRLCEIVCEEAIQLVLVAGDVYDTYNPSAESEQLFFNALERLGDGGRRAVVVVAGNHDSPDRLIAANPLAAKHGVTLVGYPADVLPAGPPAGAAGRVASGPGWVEIAVPGASETAVLACLAYPSEARLNQILCETLEEEAQQVAYSERIRAALAMTALNFRDDTVNLVVAHLFMAGGWESDSERAIQLGGALAVAPGVLPAASHYAALGHLHRPQQVAAAPVPCRYSGSPLSYSFSEADQVKEVVIVDAAPGRKTVVSPLELDCGKPFKRWRAGSLAEVYSWCGQPANRECWVDLEFSSEQPLTASQMAELRRLHPYLVNIRVNLTQTDQTGTETRLSEMSLTEKFSLFVTRQTGAEPTAELLEFFLELINQEDGVNGDCTGGVVA